MLYTNDIDHILAQEDGFRGTFALDKLPSGEIRPSSLVVNSDNENQAGKHWMAIILPPQPLTFAIFIDPYGLPLHTVYRDIHNYLALYSTHTREIPFPIQSITSDTCGYFCAYIIHHLPEWNYDISRLIEHNFSSSDLMTNDSIVSKWYKNKLQSMT